MHRSNTFSAAASAAQRVQPTVALMLPLAAPPAAKPGTRTCWAALQRVCAVHAVHARCTRGSECNGRARRR